MPKAKMRTYYVVWAPHGDIAPAIETIKVIDCFGFNGTIHMARNSIEADTVRKGRYIQRYGEGRIQVIEAHSNTWFWL